MTSSDNFDLDAQEGRPDREEQPDLAHERPSDPMPTPSVTELARDPSMTGLAPKVRLDDLPDRIEHHDVAFSTTEMRAVRSDQSVPAPGKPGVLLVEDSVEFAAIVRETLRRIKVDVFHAKDGRTATDYIRTNMPHLVLLDLNLPDMTGWSILEFIKSSYAGRPDNELPKVIVLTAYNDPANRLVGKLQEVFRFLVKTTTPLELQAVIREALAER
ncbi:MAG: response regulator [Chloroflexi bacterium]|nr:response regulator [Chloroflexota bacterium]